MKLQISTTLEIETTTCCNCGIQFGAPSAFLRERREQGGNFYCPNGHQLHFGDNDLDKVKKALAAEQTKRAQADARFVAERQRVRDEQQRTETVRRSLAAQKGVTTRIKNRVANGVCPCCNRHFTNLERHMKGQHPEFQTEVTS